MSTVEHVLSKAQPGLPLNPLYGAYMALELIDRARSQDVVLNGIKTLNAAAEKLGSGHGVVAAFDPKLWAEWSGAAPPDGPSGDSILSETTHFDDQGADVWLFLKAMDKAGCDELLRQARELLAPLAESVRLTLSKRRRDDRVLDRHIPDGITNPMDPAGIVDGVLHEQDDTWQGSSWVFIQRFLVDWGSYGNLGPDNQESVIGRTRDGVLIANDDERAHIRRARVFDNNRNNKKILRQAMPFGRADSGMGREQGIYFVAFASKTDTLEQILRSMVGGGFGHGPSDRLLQYIKGDFGGYLYVPSAAELSLGSGPAPADIDLDPFWAETSSNGLMFYSSESYLNTMGTGRYIAGDPPSQRILSLTAKIFSKWRDNWYFEFDIPTMPTLQDVTDFSQTDYAALSIPIRRGMAIKAMLSEIATDRIWPRCPDSWYFGADQFRVEPDDILVGVMPELSLGRGKQIMRYLTDDEQLTGFLAEIDDGGAMGHIVPDHARAVDKGIGSLLSELRARQAAARDTTQREFYQSAIFALEGVQGWCGNYAWLCRQEATTQPEGSPGQVNLLELADRMERLTTDKPRSLVEAAQIVFVMHCCLHIVGNPTAVGRLDQILDREYPIKTSDGQAQEIIDALWVKLGEKALHNRAHATDHSYLGTTAVAYASGNFAQGGGINQWVQQVTVGGYKGTDDVEPVGGCNRYTLMCLRASRRLPLNAPCLSLRLYPGMPEECVTEAAMALLSGGAHPILFHDERMVAALHEREKFTLRDARNYACDGCYEPMIAGATEFAFGNVAPLDAVACTMNRGAKLLSAGTVHLRGMKASYPSPAPETIATFKDFKAIFARHLKFLTTGFFAGVLRNYGAVWNFCPSPLLSSLLEGCIESGRDLSNGGARIHLIAPMYVGSANTIDALYAIKKMVYDPETAVTTLPELLQALYNDWGFDIAEPFVSDFAGPITHEEKAHRFQELRSVALALPKWGSGNTEVDELGDEVMTLIAKTAHDVLYAKSGPVHKIVADIKQKYSMPGRPWRIHLQVGIGTFEGYVGDGLDNGASADGRRAGQPYASDFSPAPVPTDLDPVAQDPDAENAMPDVNRPIYTAMSSWNRDSINLGISNAAPVDLNIREDFPQADLEAFINAFIDGEVGSNLITVTTADPDTYAAAVAHPERYELVRVRMGGWTEYFSAMFSAHQFQHARRPFFIPQPLPKA